MWAVVLPPKDRICSLLMLVVFKTAFRRLRSLALDQTRYTLQREVYGVRNPSIDR